MLVRFTVNTVIPHRLQLVPEAQQPILAKPKMKWRDGELRTFEVALKSNTGRTDICVEWEEDLPLDQETDIKFAPSGSTYLDLLPNPEPYGIFLTKVLGLWESIAHDLVWHVARNLSVFSRDRELLNSLTRASNKDASKGFFIESASITAGGEKIPITWDGRYVQWVQFRPIALCENDVVAAIMGKDSRAIAFLNRAEEAWRFKDWGLAIVMWQSAVETTVYAKQEGPNPHYAPSKHFGSGGKVVDLRAEDNALYVSLHELLGARNLYVHNGELSVRIYDPASDTSGPQTRDLDHRSDPDRFRDAAVNIFRRISPSN